MYAFCIARGCKIFLYHKLIKLLIMVKIIVAVIMITAAQASAAVYAQKATIIVNNAPLREVFKELREQTGYHFLFLMEDLEATKPVTLDLKQASLEEILARCFVNQPLTYRVRGNRVLVSRKSESTNAADKEPVVEQQQTVTGIVTDENNQPMPGVTVSVKGSTLATSTDNQGRFQIQVPNPQAVLVFTILGYKTQEHPVAGNHVINARLIAAISDLDEVVVVGYGTMRKSDLTGSVAQIKSEDLQAVPVYNMEQALKGRAAGVQVTQNSGQPGGRIEVRVRGGNSMIGNNQPLYVVDGFPVTGGINFLNPADIESIDILKDASATAIYGARGANGVVIITSKKGKTGQAGRIELSSFYGVQNETKRYDLLNAKEYGQIANEWLRNGGQEPYFNIDEIQNPGTDWQDVVLRAAPIQDHTITFSGGSEKTQYSVSGNYYGQDGILINTGVKRGSARVNLGHDIKDWLRFNVNLNLSRREQLSVPVNNGYRGTSVLSAAASAPPTLPVYDENGLPTQIERIYSFGSSDMRNPLIFAEDKTTTLGNTVIGNTGLDVKLTKDLVFRTMVGLEYANSLADQFRPIIFETDRGYARQRTDYRSSFLNENTLTYTKDFDDVHRLTVLGGYTYQTNRNRFFQAEVSGLPGNTTGNYDLSAAETINPPTSGISEWVLASWLARANYAFADKYLLTASLRADGSSRFGNNNKWAAFPSAAIAWRISEEAFMEDVAVINDLKLRASYGMTGNTALDPYQSLDQMIAVRTIYGDNEEVVGYVPNGISNEDLKWETTAQTDIGVDISFWNSRLNVTADYYWKYTTDLLASVPLPPSVGFGSMFQNVGEIRNQGFELGVNGDVLTGDWKWNVAAMLGTNRNEVVKIAGGSDIYSAGQAAVWSSTNIAREGEPLGALFGYIEDGLNENGLIKYKDTNGDGTVNAQDRVILGNPTPDWIYSLNSTLSYKGINLNIFLEGVQGNEIFNATNGTHLNSFQRGSNQFRDIIGNYWTVENPDPNAKYPKISAATNVDISDRFIENGSYLRVKNISLGYDLPMTKWGVTWCNALHVYVSGTNLFTFTNYTGLDPEMNTRGDDSQDIGNRLRMGHDQSGYPNAKVYAIGLRLTL